VQHMSIFPMAAQIEVKSATSVGMGDGTAQSRSATPRTSTSQQLGVPEAQTAEAAWRLSLVAGVATELAMRPPRTKMVVNEVLILAFLLVGLEVFEVGFVCEVR